MSEQGTKPVISEQAELTTAPGHAQLYDIKSEV